MTVLSIYVISANFFVIIKCLQCFDTGDVNSRVLHSRVERCNSQVSVETLDFTQVCTFYRHDWTWIAGRGVTGDNYPAHNRPIVGLSLVSILRS